MRRRLTRFPRHGRTDQPGGQGRPAPRYRPGVVRSGGRTDLDGGVQGRQHGGRTGNALIETISVDTDGRPGWAYTSRATLLVYLVTEPQTIWRDQHGTAAASVTAVVGGLSDCAQAINDGYSTHGLLVPLDELERIAAAVY